MNRTKPEFSIRISKSDGVVVRVAIEIHTAVFTSLKHLQYTQEAQLSFRIVSHVQRTTQSFSLL